MCPVFWLQKGCCRSVRAEWTLIITLPYTNMIKSHLIKLSVPQSDTLSFLLHSGRIQEFRWFQADFNQKWQECQRNRERTQCLPAKVTSAGISGDLKLPPLYKSPFLLCSLFWQMPTGEKVDFWLSSFTASQAWLLWGNHADLVVKSIFIIKSVSKLDLTLHACFQQTCLAAGVNYPSTLCFQSNSEYSFPECLTPSSTGDNGWVHPFLPRHSLYGVPSKDSWCKIIYLLSSIIWTASIIGENPIYVGWVI